MSQKKQKELRRKNQTSRKSSASHLRNSQRVLFLAIIVAILFFISFFWGVVATLPQPEQLEKTDFVIGYANGTSKIHYSRVPLEQAKEVFVRMINTFPDQEVRTNLVLLIQSGEWQVMYIPKGLFALDALAHEIFINPNALLEKQYQLGYLNSFLFHEYYHWQDWLGNNSDSSKYRPCELEGYQSRDCQLEWWDAEWRAVRAQAIFLQKYDYVNEMTTGPRVNNQAIFAKNNPDHAALEFLRINYYIGRRAGSQQLIQVFSEFYRYKIREINFLN